MMAGGNGQKPKPGKFLECKVQVNGKKCGYKAPTIHDLEVHLRSVHGITR